MCLAIAAKAGKLVPESHLRSGWAGNFHGAGFAYVGPKGVEISKGHMALADFLRAYKAAYDANPNSPFIIHFRTATHGVKNEANTHPFPGKYGALVHNGVFGGLGNFSVSDTAQFAEILADVPEERLPAVVKQIEKVDKRGWSKVVFLGNSGKFYFVRENEGKWDNGVWYSNTGYKSGRMDFGGNYCGD